jgi:DNA (cytosine-5)-methyltransferase 1
MGGEAEDVPIHRLTEFTVFDSEGRLAPLDAGLIEKDHELFCCGVIKVFHPTRPPCRLLSSPLNLLVP